MREKGTDGDLIRAELAAPIVEPPSLACRHTLLRYKCTHCSWRRRGRRGPQGPQRTCGTWPRCVVLYDRVDWVKDGRFMCAMCGCFTQGWAGRAVNPIVPGRPVQTPPPFDWSHSGAVDTLNAHPEAPGLPTLRNSPSTAPLFAATQIDRRLIDRDRPSVKRRSRWTPQRRL